MPIIAIAEDHWARIMAIQAQAYRSIAPESLETLQSKWLQSPSSCFVYAQEGEVLAYLLAHPWSRHEPPKLYEPLAERANGDVLFLHDLAVMENRAGRGVGKQLVAHLLTYAQARDFTRITLVAIQDSRPFWEKFGFTSQDQTATHEFYGTGATVMVKTLNK